MAAPLSNAPNGRNAKGQFLPGNKGGPGNPYAAKVAAYRQAFYAVVTDEALQAVVRKLLIAALEGDMAATKLVLQYCLGAGHEAVEVQTGDDGYIRIVRHYDADGST